MHWRARISYTKFTFHLFETIILLSHDELLLIVDLLGWQLFCNFNGNTGGPGMALINVVSPVLRALTTLISSILLHV